jgi:hypothetical protein
MGEQPKPARTDFESMTHEQLAALIESATSESASHLATKLSKAASTITKIGDDLMQHVKGLEWQGDGGDAFRDWGGQTASATLRLGQYAEAASRWMATVSQAIAEAKAAMPDPSETAQAQADLRDAHKTIAAAQEPGARNDPDARKLAQTAKTDAAAAQTRIEAAHAEAVQQLRKLAQTYEYSAQQVNSVEPPTFSPPADHTGTAQWWGRDAAQQYVPTGSFISGNSPGATPSSESTVSSKGTFATTHPRREILPTVAPRATDTDAVRSSPVSMGIDGLAALPHMSAPATSTPPPTTGGTSVSHLDVPLAQPSIFPPTFQNSGSSGASSATPGRVPPAFRTPALPGSQSTGSGGAGIRMPRESGIIGGRAVSPSAGRPTGGIPRGTVIGGQGVQGRAPVTRGSASGVAETNRGSTGGMPGGRRLASQPGGMIGKPANQSGRVTARPFTSDGTGLQRQNRPAEPSSTSAHSRPSTPGQAGKAQTSQQDRKQGERPEYLAEDEETWQRSDRRVVPPVVD